MTKSGRQVLRYLSLLFVVLSTASCSDRALSLFFDIPPPTAEELAAKAVAEASAKAIAENAVRAAEAAANASKDQGGASQGDVAALVTVPKDDVRPEIEQAPTWDQAKQYLPLDREGRKGRPNWTEAVRRGIIKPRGTVAGRVSPPHQTSNYDFFIAAPESDPGYEAYFPHSTHTEWIACESCHPKIFPVRGEKMTKRQIKKGKFCGACHAKKGGTAFWLRACDRCHLLAKD